MISAWWLLVLVPAVAVVVFVGALGALELIERLMLKAFKGIWR